MDEPQLTITLPAGDWQIMQAGLLELPAKHSLPTLNRLAVALADAQKPVELKEAAE